jgi:uncharacterized protein with PIN domain
MVLVDTSSWIEWLIGSPTGDKVAEILPEQSDWLVPTVVQLELAKWLTRELGEDKADQVIAFTQVCQVIPLDTEIALAAAEACRVHKLATADAWGHPAYLRRAFRRIDGRDPDREGHCLTKGHSEAAMFSLIRRTITASRSGSSSATTIGFRPSAWPRARAAPMSQPMTALPATRIWPPRRPTRSQACQPSWVWGWFSRAGQSGHCFPQAAQ